MAVLAGQRSFDDLGSPLHDVTFCVVDLETTGGSAADCAITEIGAIRLRSGECLGTFQTLVNPGCAIPPSITFLTGITEAMVTPAPRIEEVLPSLMEFIGGSALARRLVREEVPDCKLGTLASALPARPSAKVRLVHCDDTLASTLPAIPEISRPR